MHMETALVSTAVGATMWGLSSTSLGAALTKIGKEKLPLMVGAGAFVFGAQMMNCAIPATGASGHLVGAVFLTALVGPCAAFVTMAAILLIQCLGFNDGGFLAYGANLFNMGLIGCLCGAIAFRGGQKSPASTMLRAMVASVVALQLGALAVCAEVALSGISTLHMGDFLTAMQPIHLAIGVGEGLLTGLLLVAAQARVFSWKALTASFALCAVVLVFGLSTFASTAPDGLEWSIERATIQE